VKFKIDENLPFLIKPMIEKEGSNKADSVFHEGLKGISDKKLIEHCLKEKKIIITLDTDFINLNQENYGIIILRSYQQGKNAIRALFSNFLKNFDLKRAKNKIVIVESNQIRVRNNQI